MFQVRIFGTLGDADYSRDFFPRGPNWNLFGPYEIWDAHKVEALNNIDLSQTTFWIKMAQHGYAARLWKVPGMLNFSSGTIVVREAPGHHLDADLYFIVGAVL